MTTPSLDYSPLQRRLHWLVAVLVIALVPAGFYMAYRYFHTSNDEITQRIYEVHRLAGFTVLWLVLLRLAIRLRRGAPEPPATMAPWQRFAASATHRGLYALLIVVPILGWLGVSAEDTGTLPGGWRLPRLLAKDDDLGYRILWWHGWAAITLATLAVLHIAAGLAHRFIFKDGVFERMWPRRR